MNHSTRILNTPSKSKANRKVLQTPLDISNVHLGNAIPNSTPYCNKRNIASNPKHFCTTPTSINKSDRFISNRNLIDFDYCNRMLTGLDENSIPVKANTPQESKTPAQVRYNEEILQACDSTPGKRLLDCFDKADKTNSHQKFTSIRGEIGEDDTRVYTTPSKVIPRNVNLNATRVLDAPELMDDYYLNLLSWGENNTIAIALKNTVYLWNAYDKSIQKLTTLKDDDYVTSVNWAQDADNIIAIGSSDNTVQIWDTDRQKLIRTLFGHSSRVSSLSWNGSLLSSGSRDSLILNYDVRSSRNAQSTYVGHLQEVCGLSWSPDGTTLASGGNDNILCLWDIAMASRPAANTSPTSTSSNATSYSPRFLIQQHTAAVKALAWCPFQRNILASGGGTADRTIRIWNSSNGMNLKCTDTGSQVCALQWSTTYKELVSSHGFSDNQLCLWKYPTMTKISEFRGHTSRVLHMARSPDGQTIVSAGADESLRFWDIFAPDKSGSYYSSIGKGKLPGSSLIPGLMVR